MSFGFFASCEITSLLLLVVRSISLVWVPQCARTTQNLGISDFAESDEFEEKMR